MADTPADNNQDEWNEETVYGPSTVIAALDQIEDLVESSRSVPLSASIMVNKAEILDLLDQAREALPEDLVAADAVVADADAVLGRADSAAETRIAEANSRASSTLDQANERAAQIRADAEEEAERMRSRMTRPRRSSPRLALTRRPRSPTRMPKPRASSPPKILCAWLRIVPVRSSPMPSAPPPPCARVRMTTLPPPSTNSRVSSPTCHGAPTPVGAQLLSGAVST